jgi:peroxiredoxin
MGGNILRRYRPYVIGFALVAAVFLLWWGLHPVPSAPRTVGIQVGQIAPNWKLPLLDGKGSISLDSLRGHPVWVNFFASWCPPCNAEAPGLAKFAAANPGIDIVGVDLTASETNLANVGKFVSKYNIRFPIVLDQQNAVANSYQVAFIPTSFFIDRDGVIQAVVQNPIAESQIAKYVTKIGYTPK